MFQKVMFQIKPIAGMFLTKKLFLQTKSFKDSLFEFQKTQMTQTVPPELKDILQNLVVS